MRKDDLENTTLSTKEQVKEALNSIAELLEILVGALLLVILCMAIIGFVLSITPMELLKDPATFSEFLATAASLVLGLEFIQMLCNPNMNSILEVMLLAIARQMIVEHTSPLENLLAAISVAILYTVRKYLYISRLDRNKLNFWSRMVEKRRSREREAREQSSDQTDALAR